MNSSFWLRDRCLNPAAGLRGQLTAGRWQRGRAASRAGAASQLEGSPRARSPLALMAQDAAAWAGREREGGKPGSALYCRNNRGSSLSRCVFCKRSPPKCFVKRRQKNEKIILPAVASTRSLSIANVLTFTHECMTRQQTRALPFTWIPAERYRRGKSSLTKYLP